MSIDRLRWKRQKVSIEVKILNVAHESETNGSIAEMYLKEKEQDLPHVKSADQM